MEEEADSANVILPDSETLPSSLPRSIIGQDNDHDLTPLSYSSSGPLPASQEPGVPRHMIQSQSPRLPQNPVFSQEAANTSTGADEEENTHDVRYEQADDSDSDSDNGRVPGRPSLSSVTVTSRATLPEPTNKKKRGRTSETSDSSRPAPSTRTQLSQSGFDDLDDDFDAGHRIPSYQQPRPDDRE